MLNNPLAEEIIEKQRSENETLQIRIANGYIFLIVKVFNNSKKWLIAGTKGPVGALSLCVELKTGFS